MCMILKENDVDKHVAKTDMIVYKIVDKISNDKYVSVFQLCSYEKDKVYKTSINTRIVTVKPKGEVLYPFILPKARIIDEGFHSYKHLEDAKSIAEMGNIIIKCIIPKGSTFYNGFQEYTLADGSSALIDQYVSDKIIVKEEV